MTRHMAQYVAYGREHFDGIIALCIAEGWPTFPEEPSLQDSAPADDLTEDDIRQLVRSMQTVLRKLANADPLKKAALLESLGISLTYHPDRHAVTIETDLGEICSQRRVGGGDVPICATRRSLQSRGLRGVTWVLLVDFDPRATQRGEAHEQHLSHGVYRPERAGTVPRFPLPLACRMWTPERSAPQWPSPRRTGDVAPIGQTPTVMRSM